MTFQPGEPAEPQRPLLRVVRGNPDDAELAALTATLAALAAQQRQVDGDLPPRRSLWANRAAGLRRPQFAGPGAWRASGLRG